MDKTARHRAVEILRDLFDGTMDQSCAEFVDTLIDAAVVEAERRQTERCPPPDGCE